MIDSKHDPVKDKEVTEDKNVCGGLRNLLDVIVAVVRDICII